MFRTATLLRALCVLLACCLLPWLPVPAPAEAATSATYRALLIGNNAYEKNPLRGCINDAKAIRSALLASEVSRYEKIQLVTDQSADQLSKAIAALTSWGIKDGDVTLIFYSGHGYRSSSSGEAGIVGVDLKTYSFAKMESALSQVKGTLILLIDACYAGAVIGKSSAKSASAGDRLSEYNQSVLNAFSESGGAKSKALSGSKYHVITAASGIELSYESGGYGYFTTGLAEAMGWNATANKAYTSMRGDSDNNGKLSMSEAYAHTRDVVTDLRDKGDQNVQSSPSGSQLTLVDRAQSSSGGDQADSGTQSDGQILPTVSGLPNPSTIVLAPGNRFKLSSSKKLAWHSTNKDVCSVNSSGVITANARGKASITGSLAGKPVIKCTVGVVRDSQVVSAVSLNRTSIRREVGASFKLSAKLSPSSAYSKKIRWYSSDKSVARVSSSGEVKPLKAGKAKIYAVSSSGALDVCELEVSPAAVAKVRHKKSRASVRVGKTLQLKARALPEYAANRKLTWSSSNPEVAKVDANTGLVKGLKIGKAYITATATDGSGKSAKCLLTVKK